MPLSTLSPKPSPGQQPLHGADWQMFADAEHAEVDCADASNEQRHADEMQRRTDRRHPRQTATSRPSEACRVQQI
jgi:hypothetical protein